jgi:MFS family permease
MNMIFVAMSKLHAQYGNPVKVGWLITAFALTAAASAAICGRLGDIYGRSRVLVCILAVALGGSVLSASTDDLTLIIVGRALQGASMAILPLCFGLLRENAPTERIPFGVGILGGTYVGTSGAAGLLGGVLVDMGTWQSIFVVSAASAGLAIALVLLFLPASPRRQQYGSVDLVGGLIFVPAIASILLAFSQANMSGWTWLSVSLLGLGGGALILWARYELAHQNPLINVRLLANRQILLTNVCIFIAARHLAAAAATHLDRGRAWRHRDAGRPAQAARQCVGRGGIGDRRLCRRTVGGAAGRADGNSLIAHWLAVDLFHP